MRLRGAALAERLAVDAENLVRAQREIPLDVARSEVQLSPECAMRAALRPAIQKIKGRSR